MHHSFKIQDEMCRSVGRLSFYISSCKCLQCSSKTPWYMQSSIYQRRNDMLQCTSIEHALNDNYVYMCTCNIVNNGQIMELEIKNNSPHCDCIYQLIYTLIVKCTH